jgi:hypothetical protein
MPVKGSAIKIIKSRNTEHIITVGNEHGDFVVGYFTALSVVRRIFPNFMWPRNPFTRNVLGETSIKLLYMKLKILDQ